MHRSRKLTEKAKREGYAARSVYKLLAIHQRYHLIKKGDLVLDLGCWPGSWLQACVQMGARPLGVDKRECRVQGAEILHGDVEDKKVFQKIRAYGKFDVVLSDLAPSTTGHVESDQWASYAISGLAFQIACAALKKRGNFLVKIFQSRQADDFLRKLRGHFEFVKAYKPEASRKRSKEMYYVCLGFRG